MKLIDRLSRKVKENNSEGNKSMNLPYTALSPIDDANIDGDYKNALDWALKNRTKSDIKNIALTGPYGSGKSSILKTYIKSYTATDLHFLPISLATFKEEEDAPNQQTKEDLLRQIELSILQQIFYLEEDNRIPDSRFRKIKSYTKRDLRVSTFLLSIFFFSLFNISYSNLFETLLKIKFSSWLTYALHYFSLLTVIVGIMYIIYKSIRVFSSLRLNKFNIQNAEIEISENVNKSILNHHIDEIIYFFEVTDYNVVIIEDLDRFKQTEIFTKLREINLLLNSSKKINRSIVFIYAVRDDMFKDQNERTKFFDFVIPVIPIINPSNSSQKLLQRKEIAEFGVSEDLIDSVSLFIDDMRLLHNIVNEFYLYHQKLNKSLNQNRLLAIVVYKNMFPKDFTLLSKNEGELFRAIDSKQQYINSETLKIDEKIKDLKKEIEILESLKIKDVKELRYMYLPFFISNLQGFISFNIGGNDIPPEEMVNDKNFKILISGKAQYRFISSYNGIRMTDVLTKITEIESRVDKNYSYDDREEQIYNFNLNKVEVIKREIQRHEQERLKIRSLRVEELLARNRLELNISDEKQKRLVATLLRNGFINEDYLDYVSLFYEGSITKEDHQFLINVKSQIPTSFNHKLHKISRLISKINELEFDKEYVLNYYLMDELLSNTNYKSILHRIFNKLKDESETSLRFIDGYIDNGNKISSFIVQLVKEWDGIWSFIETKSNYSKERIRSYFRAIITYAEILDIKKLYLDNYFKAFLLQQPDFLNLVPDSERLKNIIEALNIKFTAITLDEVPSKEVLDYIYNGDFYSITREMIWFILEGFNKLNENDFYTKNYFAISNSELHKLNEYLYNNINEYIQKVYLKLDDNICEDEESLSDLLNYEDLSFSNKLSIIKQVDTKINDLSLITDIKIHEILFEESKVIPVWDNLFHYYYENERQISKSVVIYAEQPNNGLALSQIKINKDSNGERKYTDFIIKLITNNEFSDVVYEWIVKAVPYSFTDLDITVLTRSKVVILLKYSILSFNLKNFNTLKESFPGLHIQLLGNHKLKFLSVILDYEIDSNDLLLILESKLFTSLEKNQIIEKISEDLITSNADSIKEIGEMILENQTFRVSKSILNLILRSSNLTIEQRIRIHNWKFDQLEIKDYSAFLTLLGEPYSEIAILGKRPLLENNEYNLRLVDVLDSKNYISKYDIDDKGIRISTFRKAIES